MTMYNWTSVTLLIILWLLFAVPSLRADDVKTVIDDSDPNIQYNGSWSHINGNIFYNSTESVSQVAGSTATYKFNGIGISVFGTMCNRPNANTTTVSSYSVDDQSWSKYTEPSGVSCPQNFFNFYTSPPLKNGKHTLVVTNLNDGIGYFFDYLEVITPGIPNVTASPSSSSAPSSIGPVLSQPNKRVIVYIALGAAVFVAFSLLALILLCPRLRQKCLKGALSKRRDPEGITAYTIPHRTTTPADLTNPPNADTNISARKTTVPPSSTTGHLNLDTTLPSPAPVDQRRTTLAMPPAYSTDI